MKKYKKLSDTTLYETTGGSLRGNITGKSYQGGLRKPVITLPTPVKPREEIM